MNRLLLVLFAALSLSTAMADTDAVGQVGPELRQVSSFKLDMAFVRRLAAATTEVLGYEEAHPDDAPKIEGFPDDDTDTLDRRVLRVGKLPEVMALLKKHGITAQDYVVGGMALMQARGAAGMVKTEGDDAWASLTKRGINTDNVRLYMANQTEIDGLFGPSM
jgi:hypothetical protein